MSEMQATMQYFCKESTALTCFSPTLFLIVAKISLPKHLAPYWSNSPFNSLTFGHSGDQS